MSDKIWYLKRCSLFEPLNAAEKERLARRAMLRHFSAGDIIYFPNEPGESVLLLAEGRVKIMALTAEGKETIFAFIEEGEVFGELAVLDNEPRNEYAEAVTSALVISLPREDVLWLMAKRADVALSITKLVGFRRRRIENRLRNVMFCSNRQRLLSLLCELLETYGRQRGQRWEIDLPLTHQELANLIGAMRETVSVTLGRLQREGLIEVRRRRITVLQRERLAAEATGTAKPFAPPSGGVRPPIVERS